MACLTSTSASRSTSPGGVRSSPNATKVQAPKKSTTTKWTVSPSFQWEMFPLITHFNTCWQLCHLSKAALSFLSVCCPAHPFAPPHFAWSTPHLSASSSVPPTLTLHLCLFHPLFSLQVTVTTTGRGWGEDIKWSLTSKLVRLTQHTVMTWLWLTSTYAHWARKTLLPFNQMNPPQFRHLERSPSNQTVLFVKTH